MSRRAEVKEQALSRANGRCEQCRQELGGVYHLHYSGYPVFHADNLVVLCPSCHGRLLSNRHRK
jgi:hypothetical protein